MTAPVRWKIGASRSVIAGNWEWPLHGLRHPAAGDVSGWYVWTGEWSSADDLFLPWHEEHLIETFPDVAPLLKMQPGSRFLIAPSYLDISTDPSLLDV